MHKSCVQTDPEILAVYQFNVSIAQRVKLWRVEAKAHRIQVVNVVKINKIHFALGSLNLDFQINGGASSDG